MTINIFKSLTYSQQVKALWKYGVLIGDRQSSNYHIMLYQVDYFYIEKLSHKINSYIEFRCFETTELLAPYLEQISIKELL